MNSLPRITQMLTELARRDKGFEPAKAAAVSLQHRAIHAGNIDRRFVDGPAVIPVEGLEKLSTPDIVREVDQGLSAIQNGLVGCGAAAETYSSVSRIRNLLNHSNG